MSKSFGLILFIMLILAAAGAFLMTQIGKNLADVEEPKKVIFNTPIPIQNVIATPAPLATPLTGMIEGSLSYPSEILPADMQVCAQSYVTLANEVYCTDTHIKDPKYTYGEGYKLQVPPGPYSVYAVLPSHPYKAYYTDFVKCGLTVACESHEVIVVNVGAGETVSGVDPQDWYNRESPSPTATQEVE